MFRLLFDQISILIVVGMLGQYQSNPKMDYWKVTKRVLLYLQDTKDCMLKYRKLDHLKMTSYSDSGNAKCVDS